MVLSFLMELEQALTPWIQQLEEAFRPYPEFIQTIVAQLAALEKMPTQAIGVAPRESALPLSDKFVLVVDPAEISRVLVSHYFKGLPVKIEFALTEDSARDKCLSRSFDLILTGENLKSDFPKSLPLQTMLGTREERIAKLKQYLWA